MNGKDAESIKRAPTGKTSRWMVVVLLIAAIVFLVRFIGPQTVGNQIRRHAQDILRAKYPGLEVSIGHGRVEPSVGLILEDIRLGVPTEHVSAIPVIEQAIERLGLTDGPSRELLRIDRVVVFAKADLAKLLDKENPIVTKRVLISGVRGHAWLESDGKLSLERLYPPPKFGDDICPRLEIRNAQLTYESKVEGSRPIQVDVTKAVMLNHVVTHDTGNTSQAVACKTSIQAIGASTLADSFSVQMDLVGRSGKVSCDIKGARFDGNLVDQIPPPYRERLKSIEHVRGLQLTADTTVTADLRSGKLGGVNVESKVHSGSFHHPASVMPVQGIRGIVTASINETGHPKVRFDACQGYWGEARLVFGGQIEAMTGVAGFANSTTSANTSFALDRLRGGVDVSVYDLMLDQRFAAVIPEKLKDGWRKLEPSGMIDVPRARFDLIAGKIETSAELRCKGVDINFDKFPYPVRQLSGTVTVDSGRLKSTLMSGRVGGRLMQCLFDVPSKPQPREPMVFSVAMDAPIAINNDLLNALTPRGESTTKLEQFVRSLNPLGGVHLVRGTLRTDADGSKHRNFELQISDGTLRFDHFPYPLHNVTGNIQVQDHLVKLTGFQGANSNGGLIQCDGTYRMPIPREQQGGPATPRTAPPGDAMELNFDAMSIALDEALRRALPETSQETWDSLAPSGVLDQLKINVVRRGHGTPLDLGVVARQYDHHKVGAETLRLQPRSLPYRLDITQGLMRYEKGSVYIDSVHAEHGGTNVSADGSCKRISDGRWLLAIDVHNGSRLVPDAELAAALPEQMRAAVRELNLRGPVGLSGLTETLLSDATHPDPVFGWDLKLQLEGNRIGDVGPVHSLRGELDIRGRKDASGISAQGEVQIDSMHVDELQITQIRGPFRIRDERLRLGLRQTGTAEARPIEGQLFDGSLRVDGLMTLSDASFNVQMSLADASVPVALSELGQAEQALAGTLDANMNLEGVLGTRDLLRGRGKATIGGANLYQLPVLVQLLNVLSITPNEESAFTNAEIDYTLIEDQVEFNNLKLWGSLIALHGSGTMDRRRNIDLTFNTRVSPRNTFTRILRPLAADRYTLWTVEVAGPINDPTIQRKALENVGLRFEKLFEGMTPPREPKRKDRTAGVGRMLQ
ncbi:AsmA-like C-terminal region-containing protein [Roseiconus lacunae]|uniref:AsmA-like C-terminal region-containing protein n=1 Tax=Roseiconus lacunae TaxID=2605694 RepID=UPI001E5D72E3|nr:AsmA-like C-terminal region-containing protein [Roseiconus lacunae]MCD0462806.1 AsmA-like C-terminal region-containing protein [Roseiconus lacunae]